MSLPRLMASALLACLVLTACRASLAQPTPVDQRERWETRAEWNREFEQLGTRGALVVLDARAHRWLASDSTRAFESFIPASTFKIPMTLIALETGTAVDETQPFKWDGQKRAIDAWNRDQTLASAFQVSAVWAYQSMARRVGQPALQQFVRDFRYGNAKAGPIVDRFWLDGDLRISAVGQIEFLRRVHDRALPLSDRTYDIARKVMLRDQGPGWRLYAKTGWADDARPRPIGWFVGWVELDGDDARPIYFALNMDMMDAAFAPRREEIVRRVLRGLDLPIAARGS